MRRGWKLVLLVGLSVGIAVAQDVPIAQERSAMRSFDDAATGGKWVLQRGTEHPGGPGRLVQVMGKAGTHDFDVARTERLIVRAGSRVLVSETTATATACLDGVALNPAARGELVKVKLTVGGWMVRAIVKAPGRAQLVEAVR